LTFFNVLLHRRGIKLVDFCCITFLNTQKNQEDDSDVKGS